MRLERKLLPIFILWLSLSSCYSKFLEDQQPSCVNGVPPHDRLAYPAYFGTIADDDRQLWYHLSQMIDFRPMISQLGRFDGVGSPQTSAMVVNVDDFGAKSGGTDDTEAFEKAWEEACSSAPSVLVVPKNKKYLLKPVTFSGPCKSSITIMIHGTIVASSNRSDWKPKDERHWLLFHKIDDLTVEGGGTINGNGEIWWENSCKVNKTLALTFYSCKNLILTNLRVKDSQQIHISIEGCLNVEASNLVVTAPETSPNTDGIHVTGSGNIQINNCVIGTGDDCISIVSGSFNVRATSITCGPGHGISIGSLGYNKSEDHVEDVMVDGANLFGTSNGVRIKTWQGGSGNARNIYFKNIAMHNVTRPIIIDQSYCDSKEPCPEQYSAVEVTNVLYKSIKGTSASPVAVTFNCSKSFPCQSIVLEDIDLVGNEGNPTRSSCNNVQGITIGNVYPISCL